MIKICLKLAVVIGGWIPSPGPILEAIASGDLYLSRCIDIRVALCPVIETRSRGALEGCHIDTKVLNTRNGGLPGHSFLVLEDLGSVAAHITPGWADFKVFFLVKNGLSPFSAFLYS